MPRLTGLVIVALIICLATPLMVLAANVVQTQSTATFDVSLVIGPSELLVTPDQASSAMNAEVVSPLPGMPVPQLPTTDQGQTPDHHLEVHLVNKASGKIVTDVTPAIALADVRTGLGRTLSPVLAMYRTSVGPSDWHFGGNIYLPDGTYTVTIQIAGETATFNDLVLTGGAPPTLALPAVTALPKGGGLTSEVFLVGGIGLILMGARLRKR